MSGIQITIKIRACAALVDDYLFLIYFLMLALLRKTYFLTTIYQAPVILSLNKSIMTYDSKQYTAGHHVTC